jgi:hypothetical protein
MPSSLREVQLQCRIRKRIRPIRHNWTEEELDLLTHLRHLHRWSYKQIQESYFPSLTLKAITNAYFRLSAEERIYRSLISDFTTGDTMIGCCSTLNAHPANSSPEQGTYHLYPSIQTTLSTSQSESITEISTASSSNSEELAPNQKKSRYNLRPNRPTTFPQRAPRYSIDRRRFPHFFKSYKHSLDQEWLPDRNYSPPSHTSTPGPSDRSPSVVSTQLSSASSLELFGLEPRTPSPSNRESSIDRRSDTSTLDYFSAEEFSS